MSPSSAPYLRRGVRPSPPSAASEAHAYASLEELLDAAGASAYALAFEEQQYTLADIYSALRAGELMTDLAQLIPILGVRRRIITCLIQP